MRTELRTVLARIESKLDLLIAGMAMTLRGEMAMAKSIDDVLADVAAQTDVVTSVKMVADQIIAQEVAIKAQLDAAIASGNPAKIQAAADALEANTANLSAARDAIAAAVVAQTPVAS